MLTLNLSVRETDAPSLYAGLLASPRLLVARCRSSLPGHVVLAVSGPASLLESLLRSARRSPRVRQIWPSRRKS